MSSAVATEADSTSSNPSPPTAPTQSYVIPPAPSTMRPTFGEMLRKEMRKRSCNRSKEDDEEEEENEDVPADNSKNSRNG